MDRLMRAKAAQWKLRKRVCKHKKVAREACWDTDEAYTALAALQTQLMIRLCWQDCGSS